MLPRQPAVGDIVHYVSYGTPGGEYQSECRAAVITETDGDPRQSAGLAVLNPSGMFFNRGVPYDSGPDEAIGTILCDGKLHSGGTWHVPAAPDAGPG